MHIAINRFGGQAPIFTPRRLPEDKGTQAIDCRFVKGALTPLRANVSAGPAVDPLLSVGALYKYQGYWLGWPTTYDVDVVPSPIPQDELKRIYWTRYNGDDNADNFPRAASFPTQQDINSGTNSVRRLGVPQPEKGLVISEQRAFFIAYPTVMSNTSPVRVTVSQDLGGNPFSDGQRVIVKFPPLPEGDEDTGNMRELSGLEFIVGNSGSDGFELRGSDGTNYTEFTDSEGVTVERVYSDSDFVTRSYVFTFVSTWGEEGPPSPPSTPTDVRYDSAVHVSTPQVIVGPSAYGGVNRVRVYRAEAGSTGASFFFVTELAIDWPSYSFSFVDDVEEGSLGEVLPSLDWTPPVNNMRGMTQMPNGFLVAFAGNTLFFSEPFMPHAWPDKYRKTVREDIVGIAVYGQTLVVATKGKPYLAYGTDPASITPIELDQSLTFEAACLHKGSVVAVGSGVAYASNDGMVLVNSSGAQNVTGTMFRKEQWLTLMSAGMEAVFHDSRYIMFSRDASGASWMIELDDGVTNFSVIREQGRAIHVDRELDQVNFAPRLANGQYTERHIFDAFGPRSVNWSSRTFTLPQPVNFGCAQVFAESYPVTMLVSYAVPSQATPLGPASATGQTPSRVLSSYSVTVYGPDPFRLPAGFLSREWAVSLSGTAIITSCVLAESMDELRSL